MAVNTIDDVCFQMNVAFNPASLRSSRSASVQLSTSTVYRFSACKPVIVLGRASRPIIFFIFSHISLKAGIMGWVDASVIVIVGMLAAP